MKTKVHSSEIIPGANHQINGSFITSEGEVHLTIIMPLNLFNDDYARDKFNEDIGEQNQLNYGQFYLQLISNLEEDGIILQTSQLLSMENYKNIIDSIIVKSYNYAKDVYKW